MSGLRLALRSKAHWGYTPQFLAACMAELAVQPEQIRTGMRFFTVIERDGQIAGFHSLRPTPDGDVELVSLFVDPPYIGQGCGRALLSHAVGVARRLGALRLFFAGDPHADGFYRAVGARQVGTTPSGSLPGHAIPLYEIPFSADCRREIPHIFHPR